MRLFTGIGLPAAVRDNVERTLQRLRPTADLRWSAVENLHITTKFIGQWPQERLGELTDKLRAMSPPAPFEISLRGFGWLPNRRSPRVFFTAIHAPDALGDLAKGTEVAMEDLGVAKESRPYSPHLTLARVPDGARLADVRRTVDELGPVDFGTFTVESFSLYLSKPGPKGSVYSVVEEFSL